MKNIYNIVACAAVIIGIGIFSATFAPATTHAADYSGGFGSSGYTSGSWSSGGFGDSGTCSTCGGGYDYGNTGGSSYTPPKTNEKPSCTLKVNKSTVDYGGTVTLEWTTKNAKKVTLSGYGEVKKNNTKKVENMTADKTFTLTVKGENGKEVTCKKTVEVKAEKIPECTIALSKYEIDYNGSVKVTWTSKNADTVTLNGSSVSKNSSKTFYNLKNDTTFTIKAKTGSKEVTCVKTVEVEAEPTPDAPECDLSLSDYTVEKGDDVTVTWSTENADTVKLNGSSVSADASKTFTNLQSDKTFTLEAWNEDDEKVTCVKTVEVEEEDTDDESPECELSLSRYEIEEGEDVTVYWTTDNADVVKLNGSTVSKNSSKVFYNLSDDKEFELEVWNSDDEKVTCTEEVTVEEEEDEDEEDLWCSLDSSKSSVRRGESVRIDWESENADDGYINNGVGSIDEDDLDEGSESVTINRTTTFTGTFSNDDEDDEVRCSVTVYVDEAPVYIPPYITLSSVPYTGLEMGPVATAAYWSFLVLWTLVAAYLIAVKKVHYSMARRIKSFLFGSNEADGAPAQAVDMATLVATVQAIINGQHAAPKVTLRTTTNHDASVDATDEFVLSQIHRNK
jgi:hypothetical protein